MADFRNQRVDVARLQVGVEQAAVEVAVVADRRAERNVDVEAQAIGAVAPGRATDLRFVTCDRLVTLDLRLGTNFRRVHPAILDPRGHRAPPARGAARAPGGRRAATAASPSCGPSTY